MKTATINIYPINELSDKAKERAVEKLRENTEFFYEFIEEEFVSVLEALGFSDIKTQFSGFYSQGHGASFSARYRYAKGWKKALPFQDDEITILGNELQKIQARHFYQLRALVTTSGRYFHAGTISISETTRDGVSYEGGAEDDELLHIFRQLAEWYYAQLQKEYEYQMSDEAIIEDAVANEFEFTEEGELWS